MSAERQLQNELMGRSDGLQDPSIRIACRSLVRPIATDRILREQALAQLIRWASPIR